MSLLWFLRPRPAGARAPHRAEWWLVGGEVFRIGEPGLVCEEVGEQGPHVWLLRAQEQ
jgi:hypothetical protein